MIDLELVDRMFEEGQKTGLPMQFAIFDKRILLPLALLAHAVAQETGETMSEDELRGRAADGWFRLLQGAGAGGDEEGAPLYVPSRIGLLLKLQRTGWEAKELRQIAECEEWMVENVHTADGFAYSDDDLETLVLHRQEQVGSIEASRDVSGQPLDRADELEKVQRELGYLRRFQREGIPDRLRETIAKAAFRVRAFNDVVRVWMLEMERDQVRAGYSPFVQCTSHSWSGRDGFHCRGIRWAGTVRAAIANGEGSADVPIRLPAFVLKGDRVTPTRTLRPVEYAALWKQHDVDAYLEAWADVTGERRCLNCFAVLSADADDRKRFCGQKCRNAAKQRRLRERNPEAVELAQKRYWQSIDIPE
jgi:hypothetical protein